MDVETDQKNTSTSPAEDVLNAAIREASQFSYNGRNHDIIEAAESSDDELSTRAFLKFHELSELVQEAVTIDPRFPGKTVIMLRRDNNGSSGFYPNFFGDTLLRRALLNGGASEALAWLERILSTKAATGKMMFLMWGVRVDAPVQVTSNVVLCPFDTLPDGSTARWIRKHYATGRVNSMAPTGLDWTTPVAVLVKDISISCFAQQMPFPETSVDDALADYHSLNDLFMLLPIAGPCAPVLAASWTTLDDPDLAFAFRGEGRSGKMHEIFSRHAPTQVEINIDVLRACHAGYLTLSAGDCTRIKTALKRILQARLRHNFGDRAVELCTALETLAGDSETNEISHKVSTRFARFIGGEIASRKRNLKLIKTVYGIRSKMVHLGSVDDKTVDGLTSEQAIDFVINLATTFIQKILEQRRIPEWKEFDITEHEDASTKVEVAPLALDTGSNSKELDNAA